MGLYILDVLCKIEPSQSKRLGIKAFLLSYKMKHVIYPKQKGSRKVTGQRAFLNLWTSESLLVSILYFGEYDTILSHFFKYFC